MKWIIGIGLSFVLFVYVIINYSEEYKINGIVYDKSITSGRDGDVAYYHVLVKYDDGDTEDITGVDNYTRFEKGVRYTFTKTRLNFHKK